MQYEQRIVTTTGDWTVIAEPHDDQHEYPGQWQYALVLDHGHPDAGWASDTAARCDGEVERLKSGVMVDVPRMIVGWMERAIVQDTLRLRVAELWADMTPAEKAVVRFGMTHAKHAEILEAEGFKSREIALAFMDAAKADGGMVA